MRHFLILTLILGLSAGQNKRYRGWCPLATRNNPHCVAGVDLEYKCAVAFKNLVYADKSIEARKTIELEGDKYTFFQGVPDILIQAKDDEDRLKELEKSLGGNVTAADYFLDVTDTNPTPCATPESAQARCITQFWRAATKTELDRCDTNALNEGGERTIGGNLCLRSNRITGHAGISQQNVELQVIFTYCGQPWQLAYAAGKPFQVTERLCCDTATDDPKFTDFKVCGNKDATQDSGRCKRQKEALDRANAIIAAQG